MKFLRNFYKEMFRMTAGITPIALFILIICAVVAGFVTGNQYGIQKQKQTAITEGIAYYDCDNETGNCTYRYGFRLKE